MGQGVAHEMEAPAEEDRYAVRRDLPRNMFEGEQGAPGNAIAEFGLGAVQKRHAGLGMDPVGADEAVGPRGPALAIGFVQGHGDAARMGNDVPMTHAEDHVDIGEAPARLVEHVGKVGPVHHRIGRAETLAHDRAQFHAEKRPLGALWIDIERARFKTDAVERIAQAKLVEAVPGVRADLEPGTEFLHIRTALENNNRCAELGQRKRHGHAGNAGTSDDVIAARGGHGRTQAASSTWKIAEAGLACPSPSSAL